MNNYPNKSNYGRKPVKKTFKPYKMAHEKNKPSSHHSIKKGVAAPCHTLTVIRK